MRLWVRVLLVLAGVAVQACEEEEAPSGPPVSVGEGTDGGRRDSGPIVPIGGRGGNGGSDEDGGDEGPDTPTTCRDVDPVPPGTDPDPSMPANQITMPSDFVVERAEAAWADWDDGCVQPSLRVTLSGGSCPDGNGHELSIYLPADGVEDSQLVLGNNVISEDMPGNAGAIRIRYTRPRVVGLDPHGEWGTCEDASGTLDLLGNDIDFGKNRVVQGTFKLNLTRCDDGIESEQALDGSFAVTVPADLEEVCE